MAQTALDITGGTNWSAWEEGAENGTQWGPSDNNHKNGYIRFQDNRSKYSRLGGKVWAETMNSNDTHTFVIVLNNDVKNRWGNPVSTLSRFVLCAVKGGEYNGNDLTNSDTYNWYNNDFKTDGDGNQSLKVVATTNVVTGFVDNQLTLTLNITEDYDAVYLYSPDGSYSNYIKIESITRTITTASSVAVPTISPASGTYDGDLSVTITPGEGNNKVVYSISGATTGNVTDAEINAAATVNLTGTGTITVTAKGYKNNEASSEVTATYTYGIPNGKSSISEGLPHTFNTWNGVNSLVIANSNFSNMETGDYVVLGVEDVQANGTVLGFRADWTESPYSDCTTVSSGNGAKGVFNIRDTQWWLKASNNDVVNAFKNSTVRMQGGMIPKEVAGTSDDVTSSITLNSIAVYKSFAISETENNSITKYDNVVVELTRSLVADTWNTICLPFALTPAQATQLFGDDYKLAEFTSVSGETMQFTTASTFEAGVPYLVKPTVGLSNSSPVVLVDVNLTAKNGSTVTYNGYSFVGTLVKKTFTENLDYTRFVASGNELKKPISGSTLKALRAYFILPASFDPDQAPKLSIDGDGEATEIISLDNERVIMDNVYYDLSGRRVMNPTKGLYIVNGRKVIIK